MNRATVNRESVARAEMTLVGSVVCIETHRDEQSYPWAIGVVTTAIVDAPTASPPYDPLKDPVHFEPLRAHELALKVTLYETLQPGSSTYSLSDIIMLVPARRIRVADIELQQTRESRLNSIPGSDSRLRRAP